jgi:hypothetical protein
VAFAINTQREEGLKERKEMGVNMNLLVDRLEIPTTAKSVVFSTYSYSRVGRALMVYIRIKKTVCLDYLLQTFVWTGAQSLNK